MTAREPMAATDALKGFMADFRAGMLPTNRNQRPPTLGYVERVQNHLNALLHACAWNVVADFNGRAAARWLVSRDDWRPPTKGLVRSCIMQFGAWLVDQELVEVHPFLQLRRIPSRGEPSFVRCALAPEVVERLVAVALERTEKACADEVWLAKERQVLYLLGAFCGLRRGEACGILLRELSVDNDSPAILLPAGRSKNRRAARIEVPTFLAERIRRHRDELRVRVGRDLSPLDRLFPIRAIATPLALRHQRRQQRRQPRRAWSPRPMKHLLAQRPATVRRRHERLTVALRAAGEPGERQATIGFAAALPALLGFLLALALAAGWWDVAADWIVTQLTPAERGTGGARGDAGKAFLHREGDPRPSHGGALPDRVPSRGDRPTATERRRGAAAGHGQTYPTIAGGVELDPNGRGSALPNAGEQAVLDMDTADGPGVTAGRDPLLISPSGAGSMGRVEIARHAEREPRHATETAPIFSGGSL